MMSAFDQLQKFRQETEYVCLKLAVSDWNSFLTEVRRGSILRTTQDPVPLSPKTRNTRPLNVLFSDLLSTIPIEKGSPREKHCGCESPICLQQPIQKAEGDSSVSSSRCSSVGSSGLKAPDPFQQYKIDKLWSQTPTLNQKTLHDIMKDIDKHRHNSFNGFETFRKVSHCDDTLLETGQKIESITKNDCFGSSREESGLNRVFSEEWIKRSMGKGQGEGEEEGGDEDEEGQGEESSVNEFMLALENTKLRKQIRALQKMLRRND